MARSTVVELGGAAGRMFLEQPQRLAGAWRRERWAAQERGAPESLFDGVVEDFIRQMGLCLRGQPQSAWAATRGVLRLSVARSEDAVIDELCALRTCLLDALGVVGATASERALVARSVDEAAVSALGLLRRLKNPAAPAPRVPFGGVVVELVEPSTRGQHPGHPARSATLH
jgi:hypothetical protein